MARGMDRRDFLQKTITASGVVAAAGMGFEHQALMGRLEQGAAGQLVEVPAGTVPTGRIGDLTISRLICGGNLFSGYAHSRELRYVNELMKRYFTPEKIMDTLELCERGGINTTIMLCEDYITDTLARYRSERGGNIQWIAQTHVIVPQEESIRKAIDNGASAIFLQGQMGDDFVRDGKLDYIGELLELIRSNGLPAGVGSHRLEVPVVLEQAGIRPDFYFKTLNDKGYFSESPAEIAAFMKKVEKPWIAFKVLAAGAVRARQGFEQAFGSGADFINIGMFDFQLAEDIALVNDILAGKLVRERPWRS